MCCGYIVKQLFRYSFQAFTSNVVFICGIQKVFRFALLQYEEEQFFNPVLESLLYDVGLYHQVLINEVCGKGVLAWVRPILAAAR